MDDFRRPGPVFTRPMNDEEKAYFKRRKLELEKHPNRKMRVKKRWSWPKPNLKAGDRV